MRLSLVVPLTSRACRFPIAGQPCWSRVVPPISLHLLVFWLSGSTSFLGPSRSYSCWLVSPDGAQPPCCTSPSAAPLCYQGSTVNLSRWWRGAILSAATARSPVCPTRYANVVPERLCQFCYIQPRATKSQQGTVLSPFIRRCSHSEDWGSSVNARWSLCLCSRPVMRVAYCLGPGVLER